VQQTFHKPKCLLTVTNKHNAQKRISEFGISILLQNDTSQQDCWHAEEGRVTFPVPAGFGNLDMTVQKQNPLMKTFLSL
jgi:hypothetical protein